MKVIRAFFMCLGMFSAIPCPYRPWDEDARSLMTACLPVLGAVIGASLPASVQTEAGCQREEGFI